MKTPASLGQDELFKRDIHEGAIEAHMEHIQAELRQGFEFLRKYPKTVTVFGSAQIKRDDPIYEKAVNLAAKISKETGYAILTGGGPGTMEAINKGAAEAGGKSLGFNISLPHNHETNDFVNDSLKFSYFFTRKAMMTFTAETYIFFPGGFGTFDELFGLLTLIQTGKIPHIPVILFDSEYWNHALTLLEDTMFHEFHTIKARDLKLFTITDDPAEVIAIIKTAPVTTWWRNLN
ncbi:MAG: TIGR00730 family Rossman fold protein [Candidatus Taylorbacteria bacterium]